MPFTRSPECEKNRHHILENDVTVFESSPGHTLKENSEEAGCIQEMAEEKWDAMK
jgi:hypothetical protein